MKDLMRFLKEYKKESILGPLFKLLEASFELFVPLVMAQMIDVGIAGKNMPYLLQMGAILLALGVIGLVCSITAQYYAAKAAVGFGNNVRSFLFDRVSQFGYREIDSIGASTLITRLTSDVNQVQNGVNLVLRLFLRSPFIVAGAMVMAFTVNVKSAFVFVVAIPLLTMVVFGIMVITMPYYKKIQKSIDAVTLRTRENLTGARVVRAFNKQAVEEAAFSEECTVLNQTQLLAGKISALLNPVTYVIVNAATITILFFGGEQVQTGILTQGEVLALVNYMSQILVELVKLATLIVSITKALASADRISQIMAMDIAMKEGTKENLPESEFAVSFEHVNFSYPNSQENALEDIHFKVKTGQTIGIIGGTGSGKTTLVNLIPRFYDATKGAVCVNNMLVSQYTYNDLREKIGIVPQKAVLFRGTLLDNMRFRDKLASPEEIWNALTIAQAREFVEQKKEALSFFIEQGGKNLSGGQKQRLTIARALVGKPNILIFDDSSSALDYATDARLRGAIQDMDAKTTVFLVSQRASSIKHADQILVMDEGRITGIGTHDRLLETCEIYQEICASQGIISASKKQKGGFANA